MCLIASVARASNIDLALLLCFLPTGIFSLSCSRPVSIQPLVLETSPSKCPPLLPSVLLSECVHRLRLTLLCLLEMPHSVSVSVPLGVRPLKCPFNDDFYYCYNWCCRGHWGFFWLCHVQSSVSSQTAQRAEEGGGDVGEERGREVNFLPRWLFNYICAPPPCLPPFLSSSSSSSSLRRSSLPEQYHVTLWVWRFPWWPSPLVIYACFPLSAIPPHPACYRFLFEGVGE